TSNPKFVSQNNTSVKLPFYAKATLVIICLYLSFFILNLLEDILIPICYALLLPILLNPLVNKMVKWKIPRILAISIAITFAILVFCGLLFLIGHQISSFADLAPEFKLKFERMISDLQVWIRKTFGLTLRRQNEMLSEGLESMKEYILTTILTIADIIGIFVLLPIYVFLILNYKPMLINFFYEVFGHKNSKEVSEVLTETKGAIQSYILGLLIETGVVAILNIIALLILGVDYAILIGITGAALNLIPYIGGI